MPEEVRQQIFEASIRLAKHVGYKNAGTLEFLVDADNNAYFIEMNPRVQVEHTITEMVTGIDIVQTQVLVAEGYSLDSEEIGIGSQEEVICILMSIATFSTQTKAEVSGEKVTTSVEAVTTKPSESTKTTETTKPCQCPN